MLDAFVEDDVELGTVEDGLVLLPKNEEALQGILHSSYLSNTPVVIRGAGTNSVGGTSPVENGIMVSLEKLNNIIEIDEKNRMAVVQPGVVTKDLQDAVEKVGLFYPPDPGSLETCTIGGNVACNAGGPRCLKYGVTSHYVLGIEGLYADGAPFKFGGKQLKNVAGYNMVQLLIGSEGTLGVITKITLKLLPKPDCHITTLHEFSSWEKAFLFQDEVIKSGQTPAAMEFFDRRCVNAVSLYLGDDFDWPLGEVYVLCLFDEPTEYAPFYGCDAWKVRRAISPALRQFGKEKISEDVVVPLSEISVFMKKLKDLSQAFSVEIVGYGHLGDGNVHVNFLRHDLSDSCWATIKEKGVSALFELVVSLGGTISGEHGIGTTKKSFMPLIFSETDLSVMRAVKKAFDPKGLLNPGKIF